MKNLTLILLVSLFIVSCSSTRKASESSGISGISNEFNSAAADPQRDGSSFEKAVIIKETSETSGVSAEYKWIQNHYPGYVTLSQSLTNHAKKPYDIISIQTREGKKMDIYFDISNFFGKF